MQQRLASCLSPPPQRFNVWKQMLRNHHQRLCKTSNSAQSPCLTYSTACPVEQRSWKLSAHSRSFSVMMVSSRDAPSWVGNTPEIGSPHCISNGTTSGVFSTTGTTTGMIFSKRWSTSLRRSKLGFLEWHCFLERPNQRGILVLLGQPLDRRLRLE